MYPNYAASEAVLASENMNFSQGSCDAEAFNACIHPFVRNTIGSMDFGGSTLNKYYNAKMNRGTDESYVRCVCIGYGSIVSESGTAFCIGT